MTIILIKQTITFFILKEKDVKKTNGTTENKTPMFISTTKTLQAL